MTVIDAYSPRPPKVYPASNDNTLMDSGAAQSADELHRVSVRRLQVKSKRFPLFTSILVWMLLAILGWSAIGLFIHFA